LKLGGNGLSHKSGTELAQLLAAIPPGVTSLDLRGNGFNLKSSEVIVPGIAPKIWINSSTDFSPKLL
ncbi:hypothetical protein ACN4Z3_17395, partial [Legionella sp. 29fVS95]